MARPNTEIIEIFRGKPLVNSAPNAFSTELPVGEGLTRAIVTLNHSLTIGTGSGPITEGELGITKGITFRTDRNEYAYKNVCGRGLYRLNQFRERTPSGGVKDAIAAATGTYRTHHNLWFINPRSLRPFDTVLDTSRNRSLELTITLGGVADLLTTVGTASVSSTVDLAFERVKGGLPEQARPNFIQEVGNIVPVNPANQQFLELERAADLVYRSLHIGTHNSATSGVPFSGTAASTVINDFSVETDKDYPVRNLPYRTLAAMNVTDSNLLALVTGNVFLDLMKDGSIKSGLYSGAHSRLRLTWTNDTLSTSQVSALYEAVRDMR